MKKIGSLVLSLMIVLIPMQVAASTFELTITCDPTNAKVGDSITCTIKGNTDSSVNKISAVVSVPEGLEITGYEATSGWSQPDISSGNLETTNETGATGVFEIGKISLNSTSVGTKSLGLADIKFYVEEEANSVNNATTTITINEEDPVKGLKSLTIGNGELIPSFTLDRFSYQAQIEGNTFSINATPASEGASIKVYGNDNLTTDLGTSNISFNPNGDTMSILIVVDTGGEGNEYTILVSRKDVSTTADNSLKSLTVAGKTINLKDSEDTYEITLTKEEIASYEIKAELNDPDNFEFDTENGGLGSYGGEASIPIIIKPKDSSSGLSGRTYNVVVKLASSGSDNNTPSTPNGGNNVSSNPTTGGVSIFIISIILIISLVVSLDLYKKRLNYDE